MSGVKLEGNALGTGVFTIKSPNSNTDRTFNLPDAAGTLALTSDLPYALTSGTAVTASGTSVDFTSIPSWVKRITVMFAGVSTNGSSNLQVQIGSGSVETTGYLGSCGLVYGTAQCVWQTATTGALIYQNQAADLRHGALTITSMGSNLWTIQGTLGSSAAGGGATTLGYSKTTSGALDRVRITTVNGTDTFDAGTINIMYE